MCLAPSSFLMHGLAVYARHMLRSSSSCARPVRLEQRPDRHCRRLSFSSAAQVTPEAKFVDMGADSLDTVRCDLLHNRAVAQLLAGTMLRVHAPVSPGCPDHHRSRS